MIARITPRHRRPFWCGGIEFPAEGRELDLSTLSPAARAAIEGENWLVITFVAGKTVVAELAVPPEASPGDEVDPDAAEEHLKSAEAALTALEAISGALTAAAAPAPVSAPRRRARS